MDDVEQFASNPGLNFAENTSELAINPQAQNSKSLISKLKSKAALVILFFILAILYGFYYFFWQIPRTHARQYLLQTNKNFEVLEHKISKYEAAFIETNEIVNNSQGASYEITKSRHYFDAKADTKADLDDIYQTLVLIKEAKESRQSLKIPSSLVQYDNLLAAYYEKVSDAMDLLREFEKLQWEVLSASGEELNEELLKLNIMLSESSSEDIIEYSSNLSSLANEAINRFDKMTSIPPAHRNYFEFQRRYHEDIAESCAQVAQQYRLGTPEGDQNANFILTELSKRVQIINEKREEDTINVVKALPIGSLFEEASALELQINNRLGPLNEKYSVEIEKPQETSSQ